MRPQKYDPRAEHRQRENLRIAASSNLSDAFADLKSLNLDLAFFDAGGTRKMSEIKYAVNLNTAKSIFSFNCANSECVGGDFDLTSQLAGAVAAKSKTIEGEASCQGWRSAGGIDAVRCNHVLRYKINLKY